MQASGCKALGSANSVVSSVAPWIRNGVGRDVYQQSRSLTVVAPRLKQKKKKKKFKNSIAEKGATSLQLLLGIMALIIVSCIFVGVYRVGCYKKKKLIEEKKKLKPNKKEEEGEEEESD